MPITIDFDSWPRSFFAAPSSDVTVRFNDKSTGGIATAWAWTFGDGTTSTEQNPSHVYNAAVDTDYTVTLDVNASGSPKSVTAQFRLKVGTFTQPSQDSAFRGVSVFIFDLASEAAPGGILIQRRAKGACHLAFMNLMIRAAITKAGNAAFDIVNVGGATSAELDFLEGVTNDRTRNVAILVGYDVVFHGMLTKAEKQRRTSVGATTEKAVYACEAISDAPKLKEWNVKTANQALYTGKSPGYLCDLILDPQTGQDDWRDGFIDYSGGLITMRLSDDDQYTEFLNLTGATDYDWRTRPWTMQFTYASYVPATNITTITSAGLTIDELIGSWMFWIPEAAGPAGAAKEITLTPATDLFTYVTAGDDILANGSPIVFSVTGGALPAEITADQVYWIVNRDSALHTFQVSVTKGGSALAFGAGSGTHYYRHAMTKNYLGPVAFGRITDNTATTITVGTVLGTETEIPLANDRCLVLRKPLLDFSQDITCRTPVRTFTVGSDCNSFKDQNHKEDLVTKVIVKGKERFTNKNLAIPSLAVKTWDLDEGIFDETTVITYRTDAYVHSYVYGTVNVPVGSSASADTLLLQDSNVNFPDNTIVRVWSDDTLPSSISPFLSYYVVTSGATSFQLSLTLGGAPENISADGHGNIFVCKIAGVRDSIYVYGTGLAIKNGETIHLRYGRTGDHEIDLVVQATPVETTIENEPVTQIQIPYTVRRTSYMVDLLATGWLDNGRLYVKSTARLGLVGSENIQVGLETILVSAAACGVDATYGPYIAYDSDDRDYLDFPHLPGCPVINNYNAAGEAGSPVVVYGILTRSLTVETATTKQDLEVLAFNTLLQAATYYKKGSLNISMFHFTYNKVRPGVEITGPAFILEGERIQVVPYTGATPIEKQIIEWTLDANTSLISLVLGDYVKDVWNSVDVSSSGLRKTLF